MYLFSTVLLIKQSRLSLLIAVAQKKHFASLNDHFGFLVFGKTERFVSKFKKVPKNIFPATFVSSLSS